MHLSYKKIFIIFLIVLIGIIMPLQQVHAAVLTIALAISTVGAILGSLADAALGVAREFGIIAGKFGIAVAISWIALAFANGVLNWAADPNIIQTNVKDNILVTSGWEITRDFVNLFFILILVAIGIATALRIKGYDIKKIFPRLILIAILINFTPLICGFMIDASEVIMDFFFRAGSEGFVGTMNLSKTSASALGSVLGEAIKNPSEVFNGTLIFKTIVLMTFNFIAAFVLITLALLFLVRHVALWVLVILSPLAFFSFILPATKKIWNMWWDQFIKWSFIGIGAGFFLYLAQIMVQKTDEIIYEPSAQGLALDSGLTFILTQSLPLIFLIIGMFVTTSISAMGAKQVISLTRKGAGWAKGKGRSTAIKQLKGSARRTAERAREQMPKKAREKMEEWSMAKGKGWKKMFAPYYWAKRKTGQTLGSKPEMQISKAIEDAEKEAEKLSVSMVISKFREAKTAAEKIGLLNRLAKKPGDLDKAFGKGLDPGEVMGVMETAGRLGEEKTLFSATPQFSSIPDNPGQPDTIRAKNIGNILKKTKPEQAKTITKRALEDPDVCEAIVRNWDGRQLGPLFGQLEWDAVEPLESRIHQLASLSGKGWKEWLQKENPAFLKYLESQAGQRFFTMS